MKLKDLILDRQIHHANLDQLYEGLSYTDSATTVIPILANQYSKHNLRFNTSNTKINITLIDITKDSLKCLFRDMNKFGYILSGILTIDNKIIKNNINDVDTILSLKLPILVYEAKYDLELTGNYSLLYHVTNIIHVDKILKQGIKPTTKNKVSNHPDRVYLCKSLDSAEFILPRIQPNKECRIFQVNILNVRIFQDPNFKDGVYSIEPISPKNIKLMT